MKKDVLIALIDKWHKDSEPNVNEVVEKDSKRESFNEGERSAKRKCAQDLSSLISLLD